MRPAAARLSAARDARPVERRIFGVQLGAIAVRLLEVVANDLVLLEQLVVPQPLGELLVELRASRLWERLVRRVPDQDVAEAERLVVGEGCTVRTDQLLAHEGREVRLHRRPDRRRGQLSD